MKRWHAKRALDHLDKAKGEVIDLAGDAEKEEKDKAEIQRRLKNLDTRVKRVERAQKNPHFP